MNVIKILANIFYYRPLKYFQLLHLSCQWSRWMWYYNTHHCPATIALHCLCSPTPGKDFSLNASFTAHCSGSTKSICILNRKEKVKHVKGKERQGMSLAAVRSPVCIFQPAQAHCQWHWLQPNRKGLCQHAFCLHSGVLDVGVKEGIMGKYDLGRIIDQQGHFWHIWILMVIGTILLAQSKWPLVTLLFSQQLSKLL